MKIKKNALIRSYAQSMGIEAAKELITKKIKSAALKEKEHYTEEETAKICGELLKEGGLIRIVAQNFVLQLERKRSEEQALLLDNIETPIWYLTDKETYGIVNKAHAGFFGMEKEKLEGRDLYDIISVEEAEVCIANNREVFEKKKQSHTEEWVKNGRGETRLLSITRTPKLDGKGDVEYVICAAEDITERKRAEERIEHLNSVLKAIRDVNQLILVEKDRDSLLQKACNALVDARGYDAAWLGFLSDGETFAMVKGSGFSEDVARFCEHVMGGDHPPCIKNALAQKEKLVVVDRSRVCGDCFFKSACVGNEAAIIRVEHANRLFGLLAILFAPGVTADEEEKELLKEVTGDIASALHDMEVEEARKQTEEKLRNAEADWRDSFNSLEDVMLIIDRDYNIEKINEIGLKLLGKSKEEVIGKKCYQIISGADSPGEECPCTKSLETKKVESLDRYEERFGKYYSIKSSPLFDDNGTIIKFVDLRRDITERKQAEEKVKEAYRRREHFLKETSHRIITPVAIIGGNTDLLLESSNLDDAQKEKIRTIRERNEEVHKLVRDALVGKYLEVEEGVEG